MKRLLEIDLIKIIAMLCVLGLHSACYHLDTLIGNIIYKTSVIAIPLFFMVSGYLVLPKNNIDYKYVFRKCFGIIRYVLLFTIALWILLGADFDSFFINTFGSFVQYGRMSIFWYFGAMLILYLLTPFFNRLLHYHHKTYNCILIGLLFLCNLIYILNYFNIHIEQNVIQTFRIWNWMFYFCIGGYINFNKVKPRISPWFIALLLVLNAFFQYVNIPLIKSSYCEYFYSSLIVQVLSVCVFLFMLKLLQKPYEYITILSGLFLPVYTFHMFVIVKLNHIFCNLNLYGFEALLHWLSAIILSILLSLFILKIPLSSKLFKI